MIIISPAFAVLPLLDRPISIALELPVETPIGTLACPRTLEGLDAMRVLFVVPPKGSPSSLSESPLEPSPSTGAASGNRPAQFPLFERAKLPPVATGVLWDEEDLKITVD